MLLAIRANIITKNASLRFYVLNLNPG